MSLENSPMVASSQLGRDQRKVHRISRGAERRVQSAGKKRGGPPPGDARHRRAERRPGERICSNRQTLALHRHQGSPAGTKLLVGEFTAPTHTRRARKGERYPQFSTSDRQEAARFQSTSETRNDILDSRNNPVNRSAREGK